MLAMELSESKVCALLMVRGMQSMPAGTGHCSGQEWADCMKA